MSRMLGCREVRRHRGAVELCLSRIKGDPGSLPSGSAYRTLLLLARHGHGRRAVLRDDLGRRVVLQCDGLHERGRRAHRLVAVAVGRCHAGHPRFKPLDLAHVAGGVSGVRLRVATLIASCGSRDSKRHQRGPAKQCYHPIRFHLSVSFAGFRH